MSQADACIEHDTSTQPQPDGSYDIALLRRYFRNGDKEAMSELFNRNADALYRVACGFLGNSTDAEDVVQATFLQVIQKGERITDSNSNLRGWMMSIVIGNCHKRFRDERKWQPIALVAEDSVCFSDEQNEMISAALRSVQGLPERYRLPVWLHYLEGYTFKEVASALSCLKTRPAFKPIEASSRSASRCWPLDSPQSLFRHFFQRQCCRPLRRRWARHSPSC